MRIVAWTPVEWTCNCFPQTEEGQREVAVSDLMAAAHGHLDTVTEADVTARSVAPLALFRRLNAMLESTEFDPACRWAEAGIAAVNAEPSR